MKSGWAHTGDNPYNILRVWVGLSLIHILYSFQYERRLWFLIMVRRYVSEGIYIRF